MSALLIAVLVGLGALAAAAMAAIRRRPLALYGWSSRRALTRAGLRRETVITRIGAETAWRGGSGPALVLLHGAGDQAGTWSRTVAPFLPTHRVIALDLPGHGDSDPRSGPLSVGVIVDGVEAALRILLGADRAVLVGNSLGAWVALLLALRHPEMVSRVVLVNGGALRGERTDITFTPQTREEARKTIGALMGARAARAPNFVIDDLIRVCRHGPLGRLSATADQMDAFVLEGRLHEVRVPVDLLWGDQDQVFPLGYAARMIAELPAARMTVLAGCGHTPHRDAPDRFNEALAELLRRPAPEVLDAAR
ncbi:MAG TPA: alpha/beta fold hydrolase [Vicinamibacterales bacterium]|jgi:pimeloyl-ACP methyl ester carboxylesterase